MSPFLGIDSVFGLDTSPDPKTHFKYSFIKKTTRISWSASIFSVVFLLHFAEAEVLKEQDPNAVDPADDDTENDDDDGADDVFGVGLRQSGADTYHDLRDPVNDRDEQQDQLHQTG